MLVAHRSCVVAARKGYTRRSSGASVVGVALEMAVEKRNPMEGIKRAEHRGAARCSCAWSVIV